MTEEDRDKFVADEIRAGRCPFSSLQPGQSMAHCPSGFPGCACADELMVNPFLSGVREAIERSHSGESVIVEDRDE